MCALRGDDCVVRKQNQHLLLCDLEIFACPPRRLSPLWSSLAERFVPSRRDQEKSGGTPHGKTLHETLGSRSHQVRRTGWSNRATLLVYISRPRWLLERRRNPWNHTYSKMLRTCLRTFKSWIMVARPSAGTYIDISRNSTESSINTV